MIARDLLSQTSALLRSRQRLRASGLGDRALSAALERGELRRLRPGWFVEETVWRSLYPERRHLLKVLATAAVSSRAPVFSHYSAAVLHGLPLYRFENGKVHTTVSAPFDGHSSRRVTRHTFPVDESALVGLGELRFTGLQRTVLDIARIGSRELALGCADAALRQVSDNQAQRHRWLDAVRGRLEEQPGRAGNVLARDVLSMADGGAESVLESVSRLYLLDLGFTVRTQVPVRSPNGGLYRLDFELVGYDVFGEADGRSKYVDPEMRNDRSAAEAVLQEKRREDWIRGVTRKRLIRWGFTDIDTLSKYAAVLRRFGVDPPAVPRRGRLLR